MISEMKCVGIVSIFLFDFSFVGRETEFDDIDDLSNLRLVISPDEGFYRGGRFQFSFKIKIRISKNL